MITHEARYTSNELARAGRRQPGLLRYKVESGEKRASVSGVQIPCQLMDEGSAQYPIKGEKAKWGLCLGTGGIVRAWGMGSLAYQRPSRVSPAK